MKRIGSALALALATVVATATAASAAIVVSPQPNTPDAAPQTEISFLGADASDLAGLNVVGSSSGRHSGRLVAYTSARGLSFVPDRAFADGDHVTVTAPRARLRFSFTVVATAPAPQTPMVSAAASTHRGAWNFASSSIHPAVVRVTVNRPGTAPGDVFVAPIRGPANMRGTFAGESGPLILDSQGNPIWMRPTFHKVWAMNFHPQTYLGQPVLTWWQGHVDNQGVGRGGEDVVLDSSYRVIAGISNANGYSPDLHDFVITPRGSALITSYRTVHKNLSAYHGSRTGVVWDSVVQEVDIRTGRVMFEWHPLAHVSLHESYTIPVHGYVWDPYHVNSVDQDPAGDLLISARNTWAVYLLRRSDGAIIWRLGGRHSNFKLGRGARFAWQHDAHFLPHNMISVYDDESTPKVGPRSRGLILRLTHRKAKVVREYTHRGVLAGSQGNTQILPNNNAFVGWGASQFFSEFSSGGKLLYDAHFPIPDETYRAFRSPWVGHPLYPPSIAVRGRTAWMSWNGATEVASWRLLAGPDANHLALAGSSARQGFETTITSSSSGPYFAVQALDASGRVIGTSRVIHGG